MSRPEWRVEGKNWPHRECSRFVERAGIRWHVQIMGSGPALLLVHGTGASSHSFRALMPLLASRFTVVAPDLPGHAFSLAPSRFQPTLPGTAAALAELLAELAVSPQVAIGHSAGTAVIVRMALDGALTPRLIVGLGAALLPLRGVATSLFAPAARLLSQSALAAQFIALRARDRGNVDQLVRSTGSTLDRHGVELYQQLGRHSGHVAAVLAMLAVWDLAPLFAELPALKLPLLLLAGEVDRAIPVTQLREVAERTKEARLVVVPRTGHLLHEEQPRTVANLIFDEIDRIAKTTGRTG